MRTVLRLTRRSLVDNKLRFGLTTCAVLLGVSFVVASFVMTDGLRRTFDAIVDDANAAVDIEVSGRSDFDEVASLDPPIDESLVEVVAGVDGVGEIEPVAQSARLTPIKADGEPVETAGQPILSLSWSNTDFNPLTIVEGAAPDRPGQFAIDTSSAERDDLVLGDFYEIVGVDGPESFELVGITRFGEENALAGAVLMSFPLDELQRLDASEGALTGINIAVTEGADVEAVIGRLEAALPGDVEAVTGAEASQADKDEYAEIIDIFGNFLLGFALVAVFVSMFIISNTFNILLGQRVRQLALIRALGASGAQVRTSAVLEALIVGLIASVTGIVGGVLLALGLRWLINGLGADLPGLEIIIAGRTIAVALIVGIGVTLFAALSPARRAATVPPVAAMRAGFRFGSGEGTRRTIIAIVLATLGVIGVSFGLFGDPAGPLRLLLLAGGAVLVFVAMSLFAPLFSSPASSFLGRPLEHLPGSRVTGHLARENAARNNKRTASTAAGLMIGLALIAMASVAAASLKASFRSTLESTLTADFLVTPPTEEGEISPNVAGQIAALPEFGEVSAVRYGQIRVADDTAAVTGTDLTTLDALLGIDFTSGDPSAAAGPGTILLSEDVVDDYGVAVGDPLVVEFATAGTQTLTVGAVFESEYFVNDHIIDLAAWDAFFATTSDHTIAAKLAPGVDLGAAAAALAPIEATFPQLDFQTEDEFRREVEAQLDSLLVIINVFLGLAIVIALLGITNTIALSVLERTREIGLMRAIGMTRRQLRGMIRREAAVVSLFGALLGVALGAAFGWVVVVAVPMIEELAIPVVTLVVYVVVATLAGLLAASLPARRASKLNVLDAISYE